MICKVCLDNIQSKAKYNEYHDECFRAVFGTIKISPNLAFSRNEFKTQRAQKNNKRFSISGVQPKLLINIQEDKLEITTEGGTHILKVSPEEFSFAAENEHLTMQIFHKMKIETADCGLMNMSDGELVYITKRFDRSSDDKIHQEDMMQAMGISNSENSKYESKSYEDVGLFLFEKAQNLIVVGEYFKRVVLGYLVGNDDYHLKNISIRPELLEHGGDFLTPVYDALNTEIYKPEKDMTGELALDLLNRDGGVSVAFESYGHHTRLCFNEFAIRIGLNEKFAETFYNSYKNNFKKIVELVEKSYLPVSLKEKYRSVLDERFEKFFI